MKSKSRARSLKKSFDFKQLFSVGRRKTVSSWLFISFIKTQENQVRFGVTVSRKVGNSVVRNKLKRWCRSLIKEMVEIGSLVSIDINFIFKPVTNEFFKQMEFREFKCLVEPIFATDRRKELN